MFRKIGVLLLVSFILTALCAPSQADGSRHKKQDQTVNPSDGQTNTRKVESKKPDIEINIRVDNHVVIQRVKPQRRVRVETRHYDYNYYQSAPQRVVTIPFDNGFVGNHYYHYGSGGFRYYIPQPSPATAVPWSYWYPWW